MMSTLDLNERMCRWPIGHPGDNDFRFCGAQRIPGRPYCLDHCALAYRGKVVAAA
jgi:GcrA cell cycle regulator